MTEDAGAQFRTIAAARTARIERAWRELLKSSSEADKDAATVELQALRGEAHGLGFTEVNAICQRLEDLFAMAASVGHVVDDEFDLAVGMALRFIEMLSRKRTTASLGGVDLQAFFRQVDQVLRATSQGFGGRSRTGTPLSVPVRRTDEDLSANLRTTLAGPAIEAYIEYASARGQRRNRLRGAWHTLRDLVTHETPRTKLRGHVLRIANVSFPVMLDGWAPSQTSELRPLDVALILGLSQETAAGTTRAFANGAHEVAFVLTGPSYAVEATTVVNAGPDGLYEVVAIDGKEALVFRPERMR